MSEAAEAFSGRILLVDDDDFIRLLVRETLERSGFEVMEAADGQDAMAMFFDYMPDVVLLDVLMPGLDGFQTCQAIRNAPVGNEVPVLIMTGLDDLESITRAYQSGATDFVTKPLHLQVLPYRVQYLIRSSRTYSELKRNQAQLLQSQRMESLGALAGGVAHDMNNVLGAILVTASAHIESQPEGSPAYRAFETISKAAARGGTMVKSLLNLARRNPAEQHELDMNAILLEEVHLLERTTLARVHLDLDLAKDLPWIRGDSSALTHAFMNLCVNAVDAMPENGTLSIRTRTVDPDWVEVALEDTGSGMAKEVLEKATEPFFTTKGVGKGTGLGLSMVYSTVKAHRGQLDIQSEPGQGTRVQMRFPVCLDGPPAAPVQRAEPQACAHRGFQVLLVDDDELIQDSMQTSLEILGHQVSIAPSGEEALAMLESGFQPDVVILDMNMPGIGGAGTLPRLRALRPDLPVLLATGRADQAALNLVAAHPKVTLMSKPFSMRELQQNLQNVQAHPA